MGTKIGGQGYSPYSSFSTHNGDSSKDKRHLNADALGEDQYETKLKRITDNKLDSITPGKAELRELNFLNEQLQSAVSRELHIDGRHMIGSSVKGTMIVDPNRRDVDVMLVFNHEAHGNWLNQEQGPYNCLNRIKESLKRDTRFFGAQISIDGNAVTVKLGDRKVDIVPAFTNPNGRGFLIPETTSGMKWIKTDPRISDRVLDITDKNHNGLARPLIRIVKDWNKRNGRLLKSAHIESMVVQHFNNREPDNKKNLHAHLYEFFYRLPDYLREDNIRDPATDERVGGYLNQDNRDRAIASAIKARNHVARAREVRRKSDDNESLRSYSKLLGI